MRKVLPLLILAVPIFLFSCQRRENQFGKSQISVSILPQKYLVDRLSDSTIGVNVIVPPGSSPEMFEPTPQVMKDIASSKLLMIVGPLEFERVLIGKIKELNPDLKIVNHSEGVNMMEDECGHMHQGEVHSLDPHIWSSPKIYLRMAEQTCKALITLYPERNELFTKNLESLKFDISQIDSSYQNISSEAAVKKFIVYHPAFGYLARDYGLEQIALEEDGKSPSAEKMKDIIDIAKQNRISQVFVQAQFDAHFIEALAKEIQAEVVTVNPLAYDWVKSNQLLIGSLRSVMGVKN